MDFDALVLAPAYAVFGTTGAVVTADGAVYTLTVQDHSAGVEIGFIGTRGHVLNSQRADFTVSSVHPAAAVRRSELVANALTLEALREGKITFNDRVWRIKSAVPKPSPNGADSGEAYLKLEAIDE